MTRQEITQVYYYEKEIELLEKKLAELEDVSLPSLRLDGTPKAKNRKSDPTGIKATKGADKKAEIRRLIDEYRQRIQDKSLEIYEYIKGLDDPLIRLIILHRCIDLCTWKEVAERIGGHNTAESLRKMFDRHFDTTQYKGDL